jgi:hypothetical protein
MLNVEQLKELKEKGLLRVENYLSLKECDEMHKLMYKWRDNFYDTDNLKKRVAYMSDSSDTRISNAFMVSSGKSTLPHISVSPATVIGDLLDDFQATISSLRVDYKDGSYVRDTRAMLNMQEYKEGSKPVPWHFDGEFLDFNTTGVGGSLEIKEAIVPKYVSVYTLYNENEYGTRVKDIYTGEETDILSNGGDLFIFDNTKFLHSVPELIKPRAMFGFRNFDYSPYLYSQSYSPDSYVSSNDCFNGFVKKVSSSTAHGMLRDFISDWDNKFDGEKIRAKF